MSKTNQFSELPAKPIRKKASNADLNLPGRLDADVIIDVGVASGTPWLYKRFPQAEFLLIEPLNNSPALKANLGELNYRIFECAAGSTSGTVEINHVIGASLFSSIMDRTPLSASDRKLEKKEVPLRKLDDIVTEAGCKDSRIGIKIDTEGYELEVLKGAKNTLKHCEFVICEASIEKRFYDSYNFSELVSWMFDRNFILTKVLRFAAVEDKIIRLADVLFEPSGT